MCQAVCSIQLSWSLSLKIFSTSILKLTLEGCANSVCSSFGVSRRKKYHLIFTEVIYIFYKALYNLWSSHSWLSRVLLLPPPGDHGRQHGSKI